MHGRSTLTDDDRARARLAAIVASSDDAIIGKDLDGTITDWNAGAEQMYGYTAAEAVGRHISILAPEDRKDEIPAIMDRLRRGEKVDHYETVRQAKSGRRLDVSLTVSPIRYDAGQIVGASAIARDITEAKRAQTALYEREQEYRAIFEAATVGIAQTDVKTRRFLRVNDAFCAITGYSAAELLEMTVDQLNHPDDRDQDRERYRHLQSQEGDYRHVEKRYLRKDGRVAWVRVNGTVVRDRAGVPLWATAVVEDVTDQKDAERAQRESEQELREINAVLEQRVAERTADAEQRAAQLERLGREMIEVEERERRRLAQLLHDDLQQLLVAAKMRVAAIPTMAEGVAARDAARQLVAEAIQATRSLSTELSPRALQTLDLANSLQWLGQWARSKYGLKVDVRAEGPCPIESEPLRMLLFQAARETLLNVVKHADTDEARVSLRPGARQVELTVEDQGRGFDLATRRAEADFSGYGLFSLQERLELMGGRVHIDSAPGRGTLVRVTVPNTATGGEGGDRDTRQGAGAGG